MDKDSYKGFTLVELLVALAVLGVIAGITIPKLLNSLNEKKMTLTKGVVAAVTNAYQLYRFNQEPTAGTTFSALLPYLNYAKVDTSSVIKDRPTTGGTITCGASGRICYTFADGSVVWTDGANAFNGTTNLNAIYFLVNPTPTDSNVESVGFYLYYTGRVSSLSNIDPGTLNSVWVPTPSPALDPTWFTGL